MHLECISDSNESCSSSSHYALESPSELSDLMLIQSHLRGQEDHSHSNEGVFTPWKACQWSSYYFLSPSSTSVKKHTSGWLLHNCHGEHTQALGGFSEHTQQLEVRWIESNTHANISFCWKNTFIYFECVFIHLFWMCILSHRCFCNTKHYEWQLFSMSLDWKFIVSSIDCTMAL